MKKTGILPKNGEIQVSHNSFNTQFSTGSFSFWCLKQAFHFHLSTFTKSQKKKQGKPQQPGLIAYCYLFCCHFSTSCYHLLFYQDSNIYLMQLPDMCIMSPSLAWASISSYLLVHLPTDNCIQVYSAKNWKVDSNAHNSKVFYASSRTGDLQNAHIFAELLKERRGGSWVKEKKYKLLKKCIHCWHCCDSQQYQRQSIIFTNASCANETLKNHQTFLARRKDQFHCLQN